MSGDERYTMEDVARLAGVSRTSVSRVFLGQGKVSDATRHQVREAAQALGYVPNVYASGLASGGSGLVGLLLRDAANPAYGLLFTQLQLAASDAGLRLVSMTITHDPHESLQLAALDHLLGMRVAALVVATGALPSERLLPFASRIPIVRAGRPETTSDIHAVSYDEVAAGNALADHVAQLGHERVAVLVTDQAWSFPEWVRATTMAARLRVRGVAVVEVAATAENDGTAQALRAVEDRRADVVMTPSDARALTVLRAARARGWDVPGRVGVTGLDGIAPGLDLLGLTTYRIGVEVLARRVIVRLVELMEGSEDVVHDVVPGLLVPGCTVSSHRRAMP